MKEIVLSNTQIVMECGEERMKENVLSITQILILTIWIVLKSNI